MYFSLVGHFHTTPNSSNDYFSDSLLERLIRPAIFKKGRAMALGDWGPEGCRNRFPAERDLLLDAFLKLDTTKFYPDGVSYWDKQEDIHKSALPWRKDVHAWQHLWPRSRLGRWPTLADQISLSEVGEANRGVIDDAEVLAPRYVAEQAVEHFLGDAFARPYLLATVHALSVLENQPTKPPVS
jgi:hypothetical protein